MSALDEMIKEIQDVELRGRIQLEFNRLRATKKFGLVFESSAEFTPLFNVPVKKNSLVMRKAGSLKELYRVTEIAGEKIFCIGFDDTPAEFSRDELVRVARLGEPIYPALKKLDEVCNAPDSELWHLLIEADNFHALQLLKYVCRERKADCIYIDPPYNTGARDWKYNNDFVDGSDPYRHSRWLSMMERRLKLAKEILSDDGVLIVTIDEKEYLHLGCLLEEIFREAHIQMVTIVTNPNGVARDREMYRVEEYAFFVYLGNAGPVMLEDPLFTSEVNQLKSAQVRGEVANGNHSQRTSVRWEWLLRGGNNSDRRRSPGCFYPVYVDPRAKKIVDVGEALPVSQDRNEILDRDGLVTVWPIAEGTQEEKVWQMTAASLRKLVADGFAKVGAYNKNLDRWSLLYLGKKQRERIALGQIIVTGKDDNGVVVVEEAAGQVIKRFPKTVWNRQAHSAGEYGSRLIRAILPGRNFSFPKSLYAVRDTLKTILDEKPDALIVDFFAGSGTTLHAVNLLNAEDGGKRQCILVTNNEVSDAEEKSLRKQGLTPADDAWQALGIARHVTWPRTVCSIKGQDINGAPLNGNYLGSERAMADGFKANAAFFKLDFLDKNAVEFGRAFKELLPLLWLKAGGIGRCPSVESVEPYLIFSANKFAVLVDERSYHDFAAAVDETAETIFFVTDSREAYRAMRKNFAERKTYQLYRDYLENFKIGGDGHEV